MKKSIKEIMNEVNHPPYYGGEDNIYECVKAMEAWGLETDWYLASAVAYICRAGKKDSETYAYDIAKAKWFLDRKVQRMIELEEASGKDMTEDGHAEPETTTVTISDSGTITGGGEDREHVAPMSPFAKDVTDALKKRRW